MWCQRTPIAGDADLLSDHDRLVHHTRRLIGGAWCRGLFDRAVAWCAVVIGLRRITAGTVVASRIEAATSAPPVRSVVVKLIYSDRSAKMASGVRPYHSSAFQLFEPAQPAGWRRCRRTPRRRNWLLAHLRAFTRHKQNRPVVSNAVCDITVSCFSPLALSGGVPFSSKFNCFQPRCVLGQLLPGPRHFENDIALLNGARQPR